MGKIIKERDNKRLKKIIESGKLSLRGGQCIDCYNQKILDDIHITITARYDDGNKWVTVIENEK